MKIQNVNDESFRVYGRVLKDYDTKAFLAALEKTPLTDEVVYVPSEPLLEESGFAQELSESVYGGMPVQSGFCNGKNNKLNAVEYHRDSEINIAGTDLILILGKEQDIDEGHCYDTSKMEAFMVPAGTMIEVYATTLHYAPCSVDGKGFRCGVILPKGTNTDLEKQPEGHSEDRLLAARNKWLIAHEEAGIEGAFVGLKGENLTV